MLIFKYGVLLKIYTQLFHMNLNEICFYRVLTHFIIARNVIQQFLLYFLRKITQKFLLDYYHTTNMTAIFKLSQIFLLFN